MKKAHGSHIILRRPIENLNQMNIEVKEKSKRKKKDKCEEALKTLQNMECIHSFSRTNKLEFPLFYFEFGNYDLC